MAQEQFNKILADAIMKSVVAAFEIVRFVEGQGGAFAGT